MSSETEKELTEQPDQESDVKFHPDYNDKDSDLILITNDGQRFLVHSLIMKLASGMFKAMIDASAAPVPSKEHIHIQESGDVIKDLLDIIYPNRLSLVHPNPTFEHFRDICHAAEKYEMPVALQTMRFLSRIYVHTFPPLLAFALASRYDWTEELRLVSTATLKLDLYSAQSLNDLQFVPPRDLVKLMELHRKRRNILVECLGLKERAAGNHSIQWSSVTVDKSLCLRPATHFQTPRWAVLKYRISEEMEKKPDGSSIREDEFWDRSEFSRIWEIVCPDQCNRYNGGIMRIMDKHKLKAQVIRVLDNLPNMIEIEASVILSPGVSPAHLVVLIRRTHDCTGELSRMHGISYMSRRWNTGVAEEDSPPHLLCAQLKFTTR